MMATNDLRPGLVQRSAAARRAVQWGAILWMFLLGCGPATPDRSDELRELLDAGDYEEVIARVQLHRGAGESGPALDFAEGVALLHQNADNMAIPMLEQAVAADSSLAMAAATELETSARADAASDWMQRAARRMKAAYLMNPNIDLGVLRDRVGDLFYRFDEDYEHAVDIYHSLYRERQGSVAKQKEWVYRYGVCVELTGSPEAALSVYEEFYETWPDDDSMLSNVAWRYMEVLMGLAQEAAAHGDTDEAFRQYIRALDWGYHPTLKQQIHCEMAQIARDIGDLERARSHYEKVLHFAENVSGGEYTELARRGLEELAAMGVH